MEAPPRSGGALDKEQLIELIRLIYLMNPDSKGKSRKRDIQEVIDIINSFSK
jgi:hypothetical protein